MKVIEFIKNIFIKPQDIDDSFKKKIILTIECKLNRKLNKNEYKSFIKDRSFIAYEMIYDTVSDDKITKQELEVYVKSVTNE
jgi:hypothetical protein